MAAALELSPELLYPDRAADIEAYRRHQQAVANLGGYTVSVVGREAMGTPSETPYGTFYEEKVLFSDDAVRTATIGEPNPRWFGENGVSPIPLSATDALCTGPDGINAITARNAVLSGWPVIFLHHQGRHSRTEHLGRFLFDKNVGRSAHHQHVYLDSLQESDTFGTGRIISYGDSRGGMTGNAVDALAGRYGRSVVWSDYIDDCFEEPPQLGDWPELAISLGKEAVSLYRLVRRLRRAGQQDHLRELLGTFDPHPKNMLNEAAWVLPLMFGHQGDFEDAIPLDAQGVRTYLKGSSWSKGGAGRAERHKLRPGIRIMLRDLPDGSTARHLDLADPAIQAEREARADRLLEQLRKNDFNPGTVDYDYVAYGDSPAAASAA